jgi:hypothetical protein
MLPQSHAAISQAIDYFRPDSDVMINAPPQHLYATRYSLIVMKLIGGGFSNTRAQ